MTSSQGVTTLSVFYLRNNFMNEIGTTIAEMGTAIATQIIVTIIPIVGIVMGATVIFFYLLWNHKQKMFIIEKGFYKKTDFDLVAFSLFTGLILFFIGLSLICFFIFKSGFSYGVLGGLIPFSTGFSLILFFIIKLKYLNKHD